MQSFLVQKNLLCAVDYRAELDSVSPLLTVLRSTPAVGTIARSPVSSGSLMPLPPIGAFLPRTRIQDLPNEQDGVSLDIVDEEDERAIERHVRRSRSYQGHRGGHRSERPDFVDRDKGLVIDLAEEELACVRHPGEVGHAQDKGMAQVESSQRRTQLER